MSKEDVQTEIVDRMRGLFLPPRDMNEAMERAALGEYIAALEGYSKATLATAWEAVRNAHKTRGWPTVAQFVAAANEVQREMRLGSPQTRDVNGRLINGEFQPWGGGCQCDRCMAKPPSHGFYRAPAGDHQKAQALTRELDDHMWQRMYGRGTPPVPEFTGEEVLMTPERARQVIASTATRLSWNGEPDPKRLTEGAPKQKRWHTDEEIAAIRRAAIEKNSPTPGRAE